jgi:D-amino-acid dehydrogenase
MKVLVLGSGVIGVTTAHFLARAGHEVVVVDRQREAALETSFANAGEISPGYSAPWAAPGLPVKALKWLFMRHRPLVIWPVLDPRMWLWGLSLLRNCTAARYEENKTRMLRLAHYSRACLEALRTDTGIRYDERMQGTLQLFRTQAQVDGAAADVAILKRFGVQHEVLDRAGCIRAEPALAHVGDKIAGGLRLPGDETGDCFLFARNRADGRDRRRDVSAANASSADRRGRRPDRGDRDGCGRHGRRRRSSRWATAASAAAAPLSIPVYSQGYSVTVPIVDAARRPGRPYGPRPTRWQ